MSRLQSVILRSALVALRGRKAGVARVGHEFFLEDAAPAEQPGAHGSDWDTKDLRRGLVGLVLEVDQQDRGLERLVQLIERPPKCGSEVDARQNLIAAIASG